ncbi:hypothetical protein Pla52o_13240 [Novipirellula galeiformis]|uniref:Uncharacterized protein n=1 Tax=Novipirellula galeiformis TaxID=2528004 RepID=A0A5C6CN64_9BACT|nr:Minf_1886 family protein [Novipirellula galeiformis]TWU25027.1 hypothetical protein Pla52o_13240 [Novipirellula galeiformis]
MTTPLKAIRDLLNDDTRYRIEAYQFIRESLHYAHESAEAETSEPAAKGGDPTDSPNHVTGQQLCESCRRYAIDQYGYLAKMVLANWGIHSTSDLGELVYNLIRIEQMRKSETDRREDFDDVFDFESAFEPEFELVTRDED